MGKKGYLILEKGMVLEGISFGYDRDVEGEVVFSTGMMGYPESYTDPSFFGQILVATYPLVGNYGIPQMKIENGLAVNFESEKIQIKGLIVSHYIDNKSHWQAKLTLSEWLISNKIPGLSGIDTRTLTKMLREKGVMKGAIKFLPPRSSSGFSFTDINSQNLVESVSCSKLLKYGNGKVKMLLYDCGVKNNIIREFIKRDAEILRVPWDYDPFNTAILKDVDGVIISNGPGDPKMCDKTINITKKIIQARIPLFGICLGNQILALAIGADTYKLKYGHRGQNQPVVDKKTGRLYVTTQNHGFAVDEKSLPEGWHSWFTNLNDNTNEGISHDNLPFITVQFHPESKPGPEDTSWIFDHFLKIALEYDKKI